jgi:hypothetical protein
VAAAPQRAAPRPGLLLLGRGLGAAAGAPLLVLQQLLLCSARQAQAGPRLPGLPQVLLRGLMLLPSATDVT